MIRRRRKCLSVTSDSSEDVIMQPRRKRNSYLRSKSNTLSSTSHKRRLENQEDDSISSDSSVVHCPRKQRKRLYSSTSDESSSSEEIVHPPRRGSQRVFSDYETGDSTDKASGSSQNPPSVRNQTFNVLKKSLKENESSQSSCDDDGLQTRPGKKHTRQVIPDSFSTTDSSDSGMPVYSKNSRNRQILDTSSEESSCDLEPGRRAIVANKTWRNHNMPTSSRSANGVRQQTNMQVSTRNDRNTVSGNRPLRMSAVQTQEELSSDSDIRPRRLRHHRTAVLTSDDNTSSSSDSDDNFSIHNPVKRGALIALRESDEDDALQPSSSPIAEPAVDAISKKKASTHKTLTPNKISQEFSSDSDGESEKCPICFTRFTLQEVGIPACCEHNFCKVCIQEWAKNNNTCPVDRQKFSSITVRAHIQGKTIQEIPIETPSVGRLWESNDWWENIATNIALVTDVDSSTSEYDSDGDGPEEVCCVCNQNSQMDSLILCDLCGYVYHLSCVDLQYVPASSWYCPICA